MERLSNVGKLEKARRLADRGRYEEAMDLVRELDLAKIKALADLSGVADIYAANGYTEEAMQLLKRVYEKNKTRRVLYQMAVYSVKLKAVEEAERYYQEFLAIAPGDADQYVLRFLLDHLKKKPLAAQIESLEKLKEYEYVEEWAYELAKLYRRAGMEEKCIRECHDIEIWFGEGPIVEKAARLRASFRAETKTARPLQWGQAEFPRQEGRQRQAEYEPREYTLQEYDPMEYGEAGQREPDSMGFGSMEQNWQPEQGSQVGVANQEQAEAQMWEAERQRENEWQREAELQRENGWQREAELQREIERKQEEEWQRKIELQQEEERRREIELQEAERLREIELRQEEERRREEEQREAGRLRELEKQEAERQQEIKLQRETERQKEIEQQREEEQKEAELQKEREREKEEEQQQKAEQFEQQREAERQKELEQRKKDERKKEAGQQREEEHQKEELPGEIQQKETERLKMLEKVREAERLKRGKKRREEQQREAERQKESERLQEAERQKEEQREANQEVQKMQLQEQEIQEIAAPNNLEASEEVEALSSIEALDLSEPLNQEASAALEVPDMAEPPKAARFQTKPLPVPGDPLVRLAVRGLEEDDYILTEEQIGWLGDLAKGLREKYGTGTALNGRMQELVERIIDRAERRNMKRLLEIVNKSSYRESGLLCLEREDFLVV